MERDFIPLESLDFLFLKLNFTCPEDLIQPLHLLLQLPHRLHQIQLAINRKRKMNGRMKARKKRKIQYWLYCTNTSSFIRLEKRQSGKEVQRVTITSRNQLIMGWFRRSQVSQSGPLLRWREAVSKKYYKTIY